MTNIPLVLLLGLVSTLQTHLAKALERQGIEALRKSARAGSKPWIYVLGVVLNNTLFVWSILAQPFGPPALFSSLFGLGLILLLAYSARVLKEPLTRRELAGALAIVLGTLCIGVENITRPAWDRFTMNLPAFGLAMALWLIATLILAARSFRAASPRTIALTVGLLAGGLGSLEPFLKGVGQTYGRMPSVSAQSTGSVWLPANRLGAAIFAASFVVGFLAFLVTQVGFARHARASLLVPAYNAAYIALPVLWQLILLPAYSLTIWTAGGLALILAGVVAMQAVGRRDEAAIPPPRAA